MVRAGDDGPGTALPVERWAWNPTGPSPRNGSATSRYLRRLISLARWAFPDLWSAFA